MYTAAVITISDKGFRGEREDTSGPNLCAILKERGFDVVYLPAQELFFAHEAAHFRSDPDAMARIAHCMECDLLILDDLGTELTNQFTVSCLYNLLNSRLNQSRSMIINTNLTQEELRSRYSDRITSRLFGMFSAFLFLGKDIRAQRLEE